MILAIVHPFGHLRLGVAYKLVSIKVADEVLRSGTAERTSRIDVAYQHPFLLICAFYLHLHQVWALPYSAMIAIFCTERAFQFPLLQIVRGINLHVLTSCQNHVPLLDVLVPEHMWVAEVWHITGNDRVSLIFSKGLAIVCAVSHALNLALSC